MKFWKPSVGSYLTATGHYSTIFINRQFFLYWSHLWVWHSPRTSQIKIKAHSHTHWYNNSIILHISRQKSLDQTSRGVYRLKITMRFIKKNDTMQTRKKTAIKTTSQIVKNHKKTTVLCKKQQNRGSWIKTQTWARMSIGLIVKAKICLVSMRSAYI